MSKLVGNIINEIEESDFVNDGFGIHVISVVFDDAGRTFSTESIHSIDRIEFDLEIVTTLLIVWLALRWKGDNESISA